MAALLVLALLAGQIFPGGERPPNASLREALRQSAVVLAREAERLAAATPRAGPQAWRWRAKGLELLELSAGLERAAAELSVQVEQAARSVREQSVALANLAREMLRGEGPLCEAGRRVLAVSERLRRAAGEAPAAVPVAPFRGLMTGVSEI